MSLVIRNTPFKMFSQSSNSQLTLALSCYHYLRPSSTYCFCDQIHTCLCSFESYLNRKNIDWLTSETESCLTGRTAFTLKVVGTMWLSCVSIGYNSERCWEWRIEIPPLSSILFICVSQKKSLILLKCPLRPRPSCWNEASWPSSMTFLY